MTVINSIPRYCNLVTPITLEEGEKLFNLLLLFSLGIMLITCLYEILIHFSYGYLVYYSNYNIDSYSPKSSQINEGGFFFESLLGGEQGFKLLDLQKIVTLFDGESIHKNLVEFQEDLYKKLDLEMIKKKKFKGFLGEYLKILDIK